MIKVVHLNNSFDGVQVLKDINVEYESGKCNMIIGASGSGKTVLLKNLIGLMHPDSGEIIYDENRFSSMRDKDRMKLRQNIGILFQGSALFDFATVIENVMFPMEFFTDQYASWDLAYHMNGLLFNRIPFVKKLNWRDVITFRGMFGHLSEKNRPDPLNSGELFTFPYENYEQHYLGTMPYMEFGVGIANIFKVLRVDYVHRLTYRDMPNIDKWGIRIQFHVEF